jgi:transglutaminase-like putative cysteine protease
VEGTDVIEGARSWLAGRVGRQTPLALALLLVLFAGLVYGMADAVRGIERGLLWPLVWTGLPLGWALAWSRVRGWLAAVVGLVAGAVPLLLHVGGLGGALAALLGESAAFLWRVLQGNFWPDAAAVQSAWMELGNGIGVLATRLYTWALALAGDQPSFDPVPVALLLGLSVWGTSVWAAWAVRRRAQPMAAATPAAGLLASTLAYVGGRAWYLLPVLASALVLKALVSHDLNRRGWEKSEVRYPRRVRSDTVWMALALALALVLVAAITPSVSVARIVDLARSLAGEQAVEEDAAHPLGLESQPEAGPSQLTFLDARRSGGLPTRHLIGSGPELSERVVMVVGIESVIGQPAAAGSQDIPESQVPGGVPAAAYYWRGLNYERYTERGWFADYAGRVRYAAGEAALPDPDAQRRLLRQDVRLVGEGSGLLYVAGDLITADREFRVAWRLAPGEEEVEGDAYGALIEGDTYRADSMLPVVGEADLRAAGQEYPAWVVERYLAVPDSVPDRVLALARDLTAVALTPYDRARAIEGYLRQFPYTLDLPSPPADQDLVDYFLFDLQKGYCDYYASAMVVLARAAGLPARLVTGYASGTYDQAGARYVVTEAEAHAWAEVYFPGYGWIEFEPTAGRPAMERPADVPLETLAELETLPEPITAHRARVRWARWLGIGGALLVVAGSLIVAWLLADASRLRRLLPSAAVTALYRRLYRYGPWLGVLSRVGATPYEFSASVTRRLGDLAQGRRGGRFLFSAVDEVGLLTELCVRALYSLHEPQAEDQARAIQAWSRLRRRLWWARLLALKG